MDDLRTAAKRSSFRVGVRARNAPERREDGADDPPLRQTTRSLCGGHSLPAEPHQANSRPVRCRLGRQPRPV
jgi:hypothetical protein